jgi:YidC/Oxa1 family membrane protein insertase
VPGNAPAATPAAGQIVTIKTDLYTAEVDTVGGVISLVALDKHRDPHDTAKPYLALQKSAERTFVAQAGLIGDGMPNHRTTYRVLPGPRELAAGADTVELKLEATAANGDKVVQTLTFHRGSYVIDAAFAVTNATGASYTPEAYFQLMRDTKQAVTQNSMAPAAFVGPVVYNETDKFKKVDSRDRQGSRRPVAQAGVHEERRQRLGRHDRALLRRRVAAADDKLQRQFYTTKLDGGLYTAGVRYAGAPIAPGATGE